MEEITLSTIEKLLQYFHYSDFDDFEIFPANHFQKKSLVEHMNNKSTTNNFRLFSCWTSSSDEEIVEKFVPNQSSERFEIPDEMNSYEVNENIKCLIDLGYSEQIAKSTLRRFGFDLDFAIQYLFELL